MRIQFLLAAAVLAISPVQHAHSANVALIIDASGSMMGDLPTDSHE